MAILVALAFGCGASIPGEKQSPTTVDISEMGPGSMKLEVINYRWSYLPGQKHVSISGTVVNNTGAPVNGAMISATLYDQNGTPVAYGDSYVRPTYLKEGASGSFDFMTSIIKPRGITATRLITVARPQAGFL
jgi:hypothetical protein